MHIKVYLVGCVEMPHQREGKKLKRKGEKKGEEVGKSPYLPMAFDRRGGIGSFKADLLTKSATLNGSTDTECLRLYPCNLDQ